MPPEVLSNESQIIKAFQNKANREPNQEFTSEFDDVEVRIQNGEPLPASPVPDREPIRHLLYGSPEAVRRTILLLHQLGYAEPGLWSRLQPTSTPGQVMSVLVRYLRLE
jgi:hypothetical protein